CLQSAMSQRLELERQRRRVAEETLTNWQQKQVPGGDYDVDLEEATPTFVFVVIASCGLAHRSISAFLFLYVQSKLQCTCASSWRLCHSSNLPYRSRGEEPNCCPSR
ncbi:MAG: hypothetical protein ACK56I_20200, partial [bacterium]